MMLHVKCERARVRMSLLLVVLAAVSLSLSLTPNHRSSLFNYCDAFQLVQQPTTTTLLPLQSRLSSSSSLSSRRLSMSMSMSSADSSTTVNSNSNSNASSSSSSSSSSTIKSVTVLGGTGFVGSRVCKILSDKGINVRSISKSGINGIPDWLLKEGITTTTTTTTEEDSEDSKDSESENNNNNINWISLDILNVSNEELDIAMGQPDAIISCIGVIGTNPQQLIDGNGIVNVKGFESARRVSSTSSTSTTSTSSNTNNANNANNAHKLQSIAYVSVSSEVKACQDNWLPEFMESYFKAKNMAEQSALQQDGNNQQDVTIVSPTFIYGGDSFGLIPPRVNDSYGSFIDQLLSFVLFQKLADISPGLIKVALRPPVSVNAVANACVNGILLSSSSSSAASSTSSGGGSGGGNVNILDTAKDINDMAKQEPATGINDAIDWTIQTTKDAVNFIQEKVKEQN